MAETAIEEPPPVNRALMAVTGGGVSLPPMDRRDMVLPGLLVGLFVIQAVVALWWGPSIDVFVLGLSSHALEAGHWWTLLTHIFLHGGIGHIWMNTAFALAVAPAVASALGRDLPGALRFAVFFLVCGVAGGLTYVLLHPGGTTPAVGASGALCGLAAGVLRMTEVPGRLDPPWRPAVWKRSFWFLAINVVLMAVVSRIGVPIAWEGHLGGFIAGLLLFGLFLPDARRNPDEVHDHQSEQGA